jgi:phosphoglycolate phosphatase
MTQVSLVIFDLDGTLVDSLDQISRSMNQARSYFGYEELSFEKYREILGQPVQEMIADLELDIDSQNELILEFRRILTLEIEIQNTLFSGAYEVLDRFTKDGFKLAIATTKPSHIAKLVVENSRLAQFGFYIQGTDGFPPKPNPDVILKCIQFFDESKAIMIGDRVEDVLAAKAAGIPSIGIAASGHSFELLNEAGANRVFNSMGDLLVELDSLENLIDLLSHA